MGVLKDFWNLLVGMSVTGKHLGRRAVTVQYPEERDNIPERSRGIVVLLSDKETGELNCTACMLCMKACPTAAIRIEAPRDEKKKRVLKSFVVDNGICCFCGLCEEACNFAAIKMATKYEFSTLDKGDLVWDVKKLQEVGLDVPYTPKPKKKPKPKPAADKAEAATSKETPDSKAKPTQADESDKKAGQAAPASSEPRPSEVKDKKTGEGKDTESEVDSSGPAEEPPESNKGET
jgi:NADH-quinone oxidoreductase subunit I